MTWAKRRAIVIGVLILFVALLLWTASKPARLSANSVLVIDAQGTIEEQPPASFFGSTHRQFHPGAPRLSGRD